MTGKTLKEDLDDWEKEVNKLIEETKKAGVTASKNLENKLKEVHNEGAKLIDSIKSENDEKLKNDFNKRYIATKDKLTRAWNELKK
jgi:hypothetical protein